MKTTAKYIIAAALAVAAVSCAKTDSLEKRLSNLESRVKALENVIDILNDNIVALQAIADGTAISSIRNTGSAYIITLSDGRELTLTQGAVGMGKAPLLSIDENGFWVVDYQDGNGPQFLLADDESKVTGRGQNGVTPLFSVNSDQNWVVSYDGGKAYTEIRDVNGNPVRAVAEGGESDSYFANVEYTDECLILTLKNGQQYKVPVVNGFMFKINAGQDIIVFAPGEKRTFSIEKTGVISATLMYPDGWNASLTETALTVQAPDTGTKAYIADSRTDVSVLAISEGGHAVIAKIHVQVDGEAVPAEPLASAAITEATTTSLTFTVTLENTTSWHYLLLKSSEAVPSRSRVLEEGSEGGLQMTVSFDGLLAETSYTLYIVPGDASSYGPLACCEAATAPYETYAEAWDAGMDIMIGGVAYNKASYGKATVVSSGTTELASSGGVYFIEKGAEVTTKTVNYSGSVILAGNRPGERPVVRILASGIYGQGTESIEHFVVAFKNVEIIKETGSNRMIHDATQALGSLVFDDCKINLSDDIINRQRKEHAMDDMTVTDCDIVVLNDSDNRGRTLLQIWDGAASQYSLGNFTAKNNIVWSDGPARPFYFVDARYSAGVAFNEVVIENNTLYNVDTGMSFDGRAIFKASEIKGSLSLRYNMAYQTNPVDKGVSTQRYFCFLSINRPVEEVKTKVVSEGNWTWYPQSCYIHGSDGKEWLTTLNMGFTLRENVYVENVQEPFTSVDLDAGVFIKKKSFASVGANR